MRYKPHSNGRYRFCGCRMSSPHFRRMLLRHPRFFSSSVATTTSSSSFLRPGGRHALSWSYRICRPMVCRGKRDDAYRAGIIPINVVMEKNHIIFGRSTVVLFILISESAVVESIAISGSATTGRAVRPLNIEGARNTPTIRYT